MSCLGKHLVLAEALSRAPEMSTVNCTEKDIENHVTMIVKSLLVSDCKAKEISQESDKDGRTGGRVVRAHATYAADHGSIPAGGPLLHVTSPSLSPIFPLCLLLNKSVYARKKSKKSYKQ